MTTQQTINQLADMFKALSHPLSVQIITIIIEEQLTSISTLQEHLPDIDPFRLYSNLQYMNERQVVRKIQKGREIYYGLSEEAIATGLDTFLIRSTPVNSTLVSNSCNCPLLR
ncbi:MAG: helix-turn-helix transcriptional regulator [Spirosoma sp.]|nr:helix-turn-helix transcriptional regulator [Spirosoma sp.]